MPPRRSSPEKRLTGIRLDLLDRGDCAQIAGAAPVAIGG
jgi:hypothetical protein